MNTAVHPGRCFCGRVEFQVSGAPVAMGSCHGESCRHGPAGPVNAFTLQQVAAAELQRGAVDTPQPAFTSAPRNQIQSQDAKPLIRKDPRLLSFRAGGPPMTHRARCAPTPRKPCQR